MSTIFRGADLPSERAQQVVQRMLGHASAAMTHDVYADLNRFGDQIRLTRSSTRMVPVASATA